MKVDKMDTTCDTEEGDCLLLNRYRELLNQRQIGQGVKLTAHLHKMPSLRMSGSLSSLANIKKYVFTHSYHPVEGLALVINLQLYKLNITKECSSIIILCNTVKDIYEKLINIRSTTPNFISPIHTCYMFQSLMTILRHEIHNI
jgi:hypothetical protein